MRRSLSQRSLGFLCLGAALVWICDGSVQSGPPRPFTGAADQPTSLFVSAARGGQEV